MGDSDDEFNRRRRDKFRREREDFDRREDRPPRGGQWEERGRMSWDKRDRRDNYREIDRRRERYSPNGRDDISPPMKRFRGDWDGNRGGYHHDGGGYGSGHHQGSWGNQGDQAHGNFGNQNRGQEPDYPTQPPMMSFKQFLSSQDDNITDEDAIKKYNEYKVDFKKQQINEFFLAHKEEEWFKAKYSPEEYNKKMEESKQALKSRCDTFAKLMALGWVEKVSVDSDKSDAIIRLLDAAVIMMEGGTDFDLKILDMKPKVQEEPPVKSTSDPSQKSEGKEKEEGEHKDDGEMDDDDDDDEKKSEAAAGDAGADKKPDELPKKKKVQKKKKKRDYNYDDSGSDSDSGSSSESDDEEEGENMDDEDENDKENNKEDKLEEVKEKEKEEEEKEKEKPVEEESAPPADADENGEISDEPSNDTESQPPKEKEKEKEKEDGEEKEKDAEESKDKEVKDDGTPKPQAYHRTHSIFLRNLAPTITKQEVEAMCKRFPGFLRVALQDPQPERRFFRRGWVTFDRTVNIKEICWNLNNIRLRDCEMGAIVNRELKQRVRPVSGITAHKTITKQDIKHAAKIVQNFDKRWNLWADEEEKKDKEKEPPMMMMGLVSNNPVLKNITDYLVDEGSYEEEAYFGECIDDKPKDTSTDVAAERDEELCKVLDRMVLYLRIVHSFDYYSSVEYPNEDEMPHRCGIMHGRGVIPPSKVTQNDLVEWNQQFESRLATFLTYRWQIENEDATRLGKKDHDAEVEKFVQANTQELAKDKWLCPLSGKKFKGPEFVRKHLFNKHAENVDQVKQEVTYFNNYLLDPKRPHLPEHPTSRQGGATQMFRQDSGPPGGGYSSQGGGGGGSYQGGGYRGGMASGYSRPPMYNNYQGRGRGQRRGGYQSGGYHGRGGSDYRQDYRRDRGGSGGFYRRDRGRQDPRGIIEYRDLDAPEDNDMF